MTNREIFLKAIEKTEGEDSFSYDYQSRQDNIPENTMREYIFSHSFAKAFWGEEKWEDRMFLDNNHWYPCGDDLHGVEQSFSGYAWQYHLQQMVLEENPIKYLEKFL